MIARVTRDEQAMEDEDKIKIKKSFLIQLAKILTSQHVDKNLPNLNYCTIDYYFWFISYTCVFHIIERNYLNLNPI